MEELSIAVSMAVQVLFGSLFPPNILSLQDDVNIFLQMFDGN